MSGASFLRRYWDRLTNADVARVAPSAGRGRRGYTFGQRYWASFVGADLPVRSEQATGQTMYGATPSDSSRRTDRAGTHWFLLPQFPEPDGLLASDDEAVVVEAASPDGRAEFFVRRHPTARAEFTLDVVLREFPELPAAISVRYTSAAGGERTLLIPMAGQDLGPATAQIALPGFDGGSGWAASVPVPVTERTAWEAATVADSVEAAVNEVTRDAWRQVRELVSEDLRLTIDEALR